MNFKSSVKLKVNNEMQRKEELEMPRIIGEANKIGTDKSDISKTDMNKAKTNEINTNKTNMNLKQISLKTLILTLLMLVFCTGFVCAGTVPMIMEWTIPANADSDGSGTTIKLPIPTYSTNSCTVDWGDGTTATYDSAADFPTHEYTNTAETIYTIQITGTVYSFGYYNNNVPTLENDCSNYYTFTQYLTGLIAWGELNAVNYGFSHCTKLSSTIPSPTENSFEKVSNMGYLFNGCSGLTGNIPSNLFANATNVSYFTCVFNECSGLTGNIPEELFASNTAITSSIAFQDTFYGCTNITSANINTAYIGYRMFYGCNNLTDITIGSNVTSISSDAFQATSPYSSTNLLKTKLTTTNAVALNYNWKLDNRGDGKQIIKEPENVSAEEGTEVQFNVIASGDNLEYQWYEVIDGVENILTETSAKAYKSNIEGRANTTANTTITIDFSKIENDVEKAIISFDYMVSSEKDNDTFSVTITDANGTTTVVDKISGEQSWMKYSKEVIPNDDGIVTLTLTYSKNESVDLGLDYGAIRNLNSKIITDLECDYTENTTDLISTPYDGEYAWVVDTEGDTTIFKSSNQNIENSVADAYMFLPVSNGSVVSFDYKVSCQESGDKFELALGCTDSEDILIIEESGNKGWTHVEVPITFITENDSGLLLLMMKYTKGTGYAYEDMAAIRNLKLTGIISDAVTTSFSNDDIYTFSSNNWGTLSYNGVNSSILTIPGVLVDNNINGNIYYCKISNSFGYLTTRRVVVSITEWENAMITEWTIPANADSDGSGTTINLPIPGASSNVYTVDWGDGIVEAYASSFPKHEYANTTETTYTIKVTGTVKTFGHYDTSIPSANTYANYYTFTQYLTGLKAWGELNTQSYGFAHCQNLKGTIPSPTEKSFEDISGFSNLFYNCSALVGPIPEDLFANVPQIDMFYQTFYGCSSLIGSIPANLFANTPKVKNFQYTFLECTSLTGEIPKNLFANTPNVTSFFGTFRDCSGLTGHISEELFANYIDSSNNNLFNYTFYGCSNITSANLNVKYIGIDMFYGCNKLTDITIGDNVTSIRSNAFQATHPYTSTNLLPTKVTTKNSVAISYDWVSEYRAATDGKAIITEPQDLTVKVNAEAEFTVVASGDSLKYKWYEIDENGTKDLTLENNHIYKSNIEGQATATATTEITISFADVVLPVNKAILNFDYMVSSEKDNDLFSVTITDANGTQTVIDAISGEQDWTSYSKEAIPSAEQTVTLTLTYSKNDSIDSGKDYGAIRNLNATIGMDLECDYTTINTDASFPLIYTPANGDYDWVPVTENDITIFKSNNYNVENSMADAFMMFLISDGAVLSFDYKVSCQESGDVFGVLYVTENSEEILVETSGESDWIHFEKTLTSDFEEGEFGYLWLVYQKGTGYAYDDMAAIKNFKVSGIELNSGNSTFVDDGLFFVSGTDWQALSYEGVDTSTLTIPGEFVTKEIDGNKYYCEVYNNLGSVTSREAELSVMAENIPLITEWTIPANADEDGSGTTIKLPIPYGYDNLYVVDWGDGSIESYDSTVTFPEHEYTNTVETTYTIKITGTLVTFGYVYNYEPTQTNNYKDYYTFTQYLTKLVAWGELEANRYSFSNCRNLTGTIPFPEKNSFKDITSMDLLFSMCKNLTGNIPNNLFENAQNIKSFRATFANCPGLTGSISSKLFWNTPNVTDFSFTFSGCSSLTGSIPVELFAKTPDVISFYCTFQSCDGLTGSIPSELFWNTPNVTDFSSTFSFCSGLIGSIPGGLFAKTPNATSFASTFLDCSSLTGSIPVELFAKTPNVTTFDGTFFNCSGLTGSIPGELFAKNKNVTTFYMTFADCSGLTGSIPGELFANTPNVTNFQDTFFRCSGLTGSIPKELFAKTPNVTTFDGTFSNCSGLTGSIPEELFAKTPNVTTFDGTFLNCSGLTGSIPTELFAKTPNVTNFSAIFYNCKGLTGAIPGELFAKTPNVVDFGSTFYDCDGLIGGIPAKLFANKPNITNLSYTFYSCDGLTGEVILKLMPNDTAVINPTAFQYTFFDCDNITSLDIDTKYIGDHMFYGCNKLTNITIGNNVESIESSAFYVYYPYNSSNLLKTYLNTSNQVALDYNWIGDYRKLFGDIIITDPSDVTVDVNTETQLTVETSGDNVQYQWYEVVDGENILLTEEDTSIYRSYIEGLANSTASKTISINFGEIEDETVKTTISFDYMVSSEKDNDLFSVEITDANGTTKVIDEISGEQSWANCSKEIVPTVSGDVILTLTYSKNGSIDSGLDYGAIKNLKAVMSIDMISTYETDDVFEVITPADYEYGWITSTEEDGTIFKSNNYNIENSAADAAIMFPILDGSVLSFDYKVSCQESGDMFGAFVMSQTSELYMHTDSGNKDWTHVDIPLTTAYGYEMGYLYMAYIKESGYAYEDMAAIRNLTLTLKQIVESTFVNDEVFTFSGDNWVTTSYTGMNTSTLTIPAELVDMDLNGTEYYCEVMDNTYYDVSETALLTVTPIQVTKPTLTGTYTYNGLEQTATFENLDLSAVELTINNQTNNKQTNAGTYTITATLRDKVNYEWEDGSTDDITFEWTIAAKDLIVIPTSGQFKEEGEADPAKFDYSFEGAVSGDAVTFDGALSRETTTGNFIDDPAGEYEIIQGTLTLKDNEDFLASNYNLIFTEGVIFTINAPAIPIPNVPSSFVVSSETSFEQIDISWDSNGNPSETVYELYASDDGVTWDTVIYSGNDTSFSHTGLSSGVTKYYKVRAMNINGQYSDFTDVKSGKTLSDTTPPVITLESVTNVSLNGSDYAKSADTIRVVLNVEDESYKESLLSAEDITLNVGGTSATYTRKVIESVSINGNSGAKISILLAGVSGNGEVSLTIPADKIVDKAGNTNAETTINTGLVMDNTVPTLTVTQKPNELFTVVTLEIEVNDNSTISSLTINGEGVTLTDGKAAYEVTANGSYVIIASDNALNRISKTEEVNLIGDGIFFTTTWSIPANVDATLEGSSGTEVGTTITLPISSHVNNNYLVLWGDGTYERYTSKAFPTHTYTNTAAQEYTIRISGTVNSFGYYRTIEPTSSNIYSNYLTFTDYLTGILDWGDIGATRFGFSSCENLAGTIPTPRDFSNLTSVENMFYGCLNLEGPIPTGFLDDATSITNAKNMFMNCVKLNGSIPSGLFANNNKVATFENTFANCKLLDGEIPADLFAGATQATSYAGTFNGCLGLDGMIPETLFASSTLVKSFRETFANCTGLESPAAGSGSTGGTGSAGGSGSTSGNGSATGGNEVRYAVSTSLFNSNPYVLDYYRTFYNCTGLSGVVHANTFASNKVITSIPTDLTINSNFRGTFEGCTGITKVDLAEEVIGHEMFKGCSAITSADLKNTVEIGNDAFYGCNSLTSIVVDNKYLISVGTDAFEYTGTNPAKLITSINRENEVLLAYDWDADNRIVDVDGPEGTIEIITDKYPFTNVTSVELSISLTDNTSLAEACEIAIINEDTYKSFMSNSNRSYENDLPWQDYIDNTTWSLTSKDGIKTVYVFFKDEYGNISVQSENF